MRHTKLLLLPMLALLAALTGCGGSGSSGFDISPSLESSVIQGALTSGECGESGELLICPSSAPPMSSPGTPAPTPSGRDVQLNVPETDALPCSVSTDGQACLFTLSFVSTGLPADATYRVAVRAAGSEGPWTVGERATLSGSFFAAPIDFPAGVSQVQIAVLVFTDGADVAPGPIDLLAYSGASFAFVSVNFSVVPAT